MSDRLTQSADFNLEPSEAQALEDASFRGASDLRSFRFYVNDFESTTRGVDIVATYPLNIMSGVSHFSFAYNYNDTEVTDFNSATLNELRILQIEESLPKHRASLAWNHSQGRWRTLLRANYYGDYWLAHVGDLNLAFEPSDEVTFDAEFAYTFLTRRSLNKQEKYTLVVGAENLFNNFPDKNPFANITGSTYPENAPFSSAGGIYYFRAKYEF